MLEWSLYHFRLQISPYLLLYLNCQGNLVKSKILGFTLLEGWFYCISWDLGLPALPAWDSFTNSNSIHLYWLWTAHSYFPTFCRGEGFLVSRTTGSCLLFLNCCRHLFSSLSIATSLMVGRTSRSLIKHQKTSLWCSRDLNVLSPLCNADD